MWDCGSAWDKMKEKDFPHKKLCCGLFHQLPQLETQTRRKEVYKKNSNTLWLLSSYCVVDGDKRAEA